MGFPLTFWAKIWRNCYFDYSFGIYLLWNSHYEWSKIVSWWFVLALFYFIGEKSDCSFMIFWRMMNNLSVKAILRINFSLLSYLPKKEIIYLLNIANLMIFSWLLSIELVTIDFRWASIAYSSIVALHFFILSQIIWMYLWWCSSLKVSFMLNFAFLIFSILFGFFDRVYFIYL